MLKYLVVLYALVFASLTYGQTAASTASTTERVTSTSTTNTQTTTATTTQTTEREEADQAQTEASSSSQTTTAQTTTQTTTTTTTTTQKPLNLFSRPLAGPYVGLGINFPAVRGYTGVMPKILIGYGSIFGVHKDLYFGIEAFGGAGSVPLSSNQRHRLRSYYGASILPGVLLYDTTIIMAMLGYQQAHYSELRTTRTGFFVGLALQTVLNERWDVRYGYDYMFRGALNQYSLDFIFKIC